MPTNRACESRNLENGFRTSAVAEAPKYLASLAEGKTARVTMHMFFTAGSCRMSLCRAEQEVFAKESCACESPNLENGFRRDPTPAVAEAPKYLASLAEGKTARLTIHLFFHRGRVSHELISR